MPFAPIYEVLMALPIPRPVLWFLVGADIKLNQKLLMDKQERKEE